MDGDNVTIGDVIAESTEDDFIATVGDVKEAAANAADEVASVVIEQVQEVAIKEDSKWQELNQAIQTQAAATQAQSIQLSAMTEILTATQTSILTLLAAMTAAAAQSTQSKPEPETTPQPEPKPLEQNPLVEVAENPLTAVVEEVKEIAPAKPPRKRF